VSFTLLAGAGAVLFGYVAAGALGVVLAGGVAVVSGLVIWLVLPRAAHRAFAGGRARQAARRYRAIELLTTRAARRQEARLSRAACHASLGNWSRAASLLAAIDEASLSSDARAVLLNNRACVALRAPDGNPALAVDLADQAVSLRPDVPELQHTQALARLRAGRIDEALRTLEALRSAGDHHPCLEAERCWDLAEAWRQRGEVEYSDDYRARALRLAPPSSWLNPAG
jgi:tetratricopeptide (TPR) repeat protein